MAMQNKNIFTDSAKLNEKGFTLLELVISLSITSVIITGVLTLYNQNFNLMYETIEESDKGNTALLIKNKIASVLTYDSVIAIENSGDRLVIDNIAFEYVATSGQFNITEGTDYLVYKNIRKNSGTPVFTQPNPYVIEMSYLIEDRHGTKNVIEKFTVNKNKYDKQYFIE